MAPETLPVDRQLLAAGEDLASAAKHTAFLAESYLTAIRDGRLTDHERRAVELEILALRHAVDAFEQKLPAAPGPFVP